MSEKLENAVRAGFDELNELSLSEYRLTLTDVMNGDDAAERMGRLIGVSLKEPFADPVILSEPSVHTAAYRAWELRPEGDFALQADSWQFRALSEMRNRAERESGYQFESTYAFAAFLHHESGFFAEFSKNVRAYICGDKKIRQHVEQVLKKAGTATGSTLSKLTPENVVALGGAALGAFLIHAIPILGYVGAPVIAGIVLILYTLGIKAYCSLTDTTQGGAAKER